MTVTQSPAATADLVPGRPLLPSIALARTWKLVERNALSYRRRGLVFVAMLIEPLLFLGSIGIGVGALVGELPGPNGDPVAYDTFVAPGLMASAAMLSALFESTFNFFIKFKYMKTYDGVLSTPLTPADTAAGEILWALTRGAIQSTVFLAVMALLGLVDSPTAVLALPATVLIGAAFGAVGLAATTWMRSYVDFDFVNAAMIPLFLFSATFFPLTRYPAAVRSIVEWTPLYQGVELCRAATLGQLHPGLVVNVAYLVVMAAAGVVIASRRMTQLLQP